MLANWWWTIDRPILMALILLMGTGLFLVAAASPSVAQRLDLDAFYFTIRHMVFLIPAVIIMVGVSFLSPRQLWRFSICVLGMSFIAMGLTLISGDEIKGAKRWLSLFGFSLQPSEFAKPAFVVVTAWLISVHQEKTESFDGRKRNFWADYLLCGFLYVLYLTLLGLQPDIGMAFVVTMVFGAQIFLAGLPLRWLVAGILCLIPLGGIGVYLGFGHVQSRFDRFFNPEQGDTYQIEQSLEAFRQGGLTGAGPGQGTVKLHLPDSHADFIFSVAGEELGFFFALALICLYGFIFLRGFNRIMGSDYLFTILAVGGLLVQFGLQAFIHMGSSLNILPTKGMTLPFISYGGSSMLAVAFAMGGVLSLTRRRRMGAEYL